MQRGLGLLLIIISASSFGGLAVFARMAYAAGVDPITLLFLRFLIATTVMLGIMAVRRLSFPRGRTLFGLILMGGVGYVGQSLTYFMALTMASAALIALLLYLYPVLVAAASVVFLGERLTLVKLSALVLALVGSLLTIGPGGGGRPLGIALGIAASLIYTVYILVGSRVTASVGAINASTVIMASAAVVYGLIVAVQGPRFPSSVAGWVAVIAIALVSTVLAIVTFFAGLERVGPTNAATLSAFEPLVTVVLAVIFLRERIVPLQLIGGALILAAVIVLARGETSQANADVYLPPEAEGEAS